MSLNRNMLKINAYIEVVLRLLLQACGTWLCVSLSNGSIVVYGKA